MSEEDRGGLLARETGLGVGEFRVRYNSELDAAYTGLRTRMLSLIKLY